MMEATAGLVLMVLLRVDHGVLHGGHMLLRAQRCVDHVSLAEFIFRSQSVITGGYFFFNTRANGLDGLAFR